MANVNVTSNVTQSERKCLLRAYQIMAKIRHQWFVADPDHCDENPDYWGVDHCIETLGSLFGFEPIKSGERPASKLLRLIESYEELRELKDDLASWTKENNQDFKDVQEEIVEQMVEDDVPSQGYKGFTYTPQTVTHYSFISEEKLAEAGTDKMEVMRENGFDFLIKETINQRSMESAFKERLENDEELPEDVLAIISQYEELKVNRRKASSPALKKAKKAVK